METLLKSALAGAIGVVLATAAATVGAQNEKLPTPYHEVANWAKLPAGSKWAGGQGADPASNGDIWTFNRADPPILRFDQSGNVVKSFGDGMFVQAHGITVDRNGDVWVTDAMMKDGKGNQVFKFSPDGKLLMTLGKAGVAGGGNDVFSGPADVAIAQNGDIFVADGHMEGPVNRIVKFSKDGKFIKAWGTRGSAPGEFNLPHSITIDSRGRIFVADRTNNRIQIFDQDGRFLDQWKQFGRPSGVFIDAERQHLRGRFTVEQQDEPGLHARHPHRQREGRQGDGLDSVRGARPGEEQQQRRGRRRGRREGQRVRRRSVDRDVQEIREVASVSVAREGGLWVREGLR